MAGDGKNKRRALGRGLEALLPKAPPKGASSRPAAPAPTERKGSVFTCPIERIEPRVDQPRQRIDDEALAELAATIASHGIIQPLVVRRLGEPGPKERFELIAGERRWRAAQKAGLKEVPIVVKDVSPETAFELALIENLQRQDLNPVEVAEAYQRLLEDHGHTHEAIAAAMGKSRVAVTNALRLLKLPSPILALLADGSLREGHGRALLGAADERTMVDLARRAVKGELSVRQLEAAVRKSKAAPKGDDPKAPEEKSAAVRDLETRFSRRVGAKVAVEHKGKGGQVVIRYGDLDELDRIIANLGV
ncbi:MAG: ParB/RepB/Spo0J family partition protein [Polyangiaceae bacterium]